MEQIGLSKNSVDPNQTAPKEQSDQGLHCLILSLSLRWRVLDEVLQSKTILRELR